MADGGGNSNSGNQPALRIFMWSDHYGAADGPSEVIAGGTAMPLPALAAYPKLN